MSDVQLVVGAVIVDRVQRPTHVLAARRNAGSPASIGRWEFPGGKVESGESPAEALRRELREELAIETSIGVELGDGLGWPIDSHLVLHLFVTNITAGEPTADLDHDEFRWLRADELDSVEWLESDLAALPFVRALLDVVG